MNHCDITQELKPVSSFSKVVIVPGNGCVNVRNCNWYGWLRDELCDMKARKEFTEVVCQDMPDPFSAKREIWLDFMKNVMKIDETTLAIGHSSGSEALMRYAETERVGAVVLVSACYSDLGDEGERRSGYYPSMDGEREINPWNFKAMQTNCPFFYQFHSNNDPFIPLEGEALRIQDELGLLAGQNFFMLASRSHFFDAPFPELLNLIDQISA